MNEANKFLVLRKAIYFLISYASVTFGYSARLSTGEHKSFSSSVQRADPLYHSVHCRYCSFESERPQILPFPSIPPRSHNYSADTMMLFLFLKLLASLVEKLCYQPKGRGCRIPMTSLHVFNLSFHSRTMTLSL